MAYWGREPRAGRNIRMDRKRQEMKANKGFQATAHKLPLCDRFPSLQSFILMPVGRRLNPDVQIFMHAITTIRRDAEKL